MHLKTKVSWFTNKRIEQPIVDENAESIKSATSSVNKLIPEGELVDSIVILGVDLKPEKEWRRVLECKPKVLERKPKVLAQPSSIRTSSPAVEQGAPTTPPRFPGVL